MSKSEEFKKRAHELVGQMTLEEKCSQMLHGAPAIPRLGIPAYNWWNEGLHGVARAGTATVFPQAIGLAASFDEELLEEVADCVATEGRAKYNMQQKNGDRDIYKGLTFWAPNINIFRDPRWGRGHETYGEDPYLTSRLGVRYVKGLQGHDENYMKTAACAKHFAVHSGPEDLRHSFNAEVSMQDLWETYLPAFEACVTEGEVEAVMGAYNRTNGEPCCGSAYLLEDVLRGKWAFDGHVVSDCWAVRDFHEHHMVTNSALESAALAVNKGCDLNCGSVFLYLEQAVKEGLIPEEKIDQAVERLFTTRMKLGMFEEKGKVPFDDLGYELVDSAEMREKNLQAAREILVLLKNQDHLLPLDKKKIRSVGIIGPNADNRRALVGNYEGTASRYVTVSEGLREYLGEDVRIYYSEGCHLYKERMNGRGPAGDRMAEVRSVCEQSDVIIACMGLDSGLEGEQGDRGNQFASGDKPNLNLPGIQEDVLKVIKESGKPVVLVVLSGSALALNYAEAEIPAIIQGWYPGAQGGRAIAELIFGEFTPEGRLPLTFYRTTEELPEFTDYSMQNRTYRYMKQAPLYPFGYGLSYTEFQIGNVTCNRQDLTEAGIDISLTVSNTGSMKGRDTIQIYVKAEREGTPNAQLKHFEKVELAPGETKTVQCHLSPAAFSLCDENGNRCILPGNYTVYVGDMQPDKRSQELTGKEVAALQIRCDAK